MSPSLRFGARTDVGLLRELNEDSMYAGPRLLAVADGVGGHAAGEVASRVAISAVAALDDGQPDPDLISSLRTAVEQASETLQDMVAADHALDGMGTTLTALLFSERRLGLVHIGDSRCYLLREGQFTQITRDHTLVQHLIDEGRITPEEATTHPQRSWITRSLTGRGELELDLSIREVRVGDRYLLCSDGLSGPVSEETLADVLRTVEDPQDACERLVDLALRAGGPDNISAIVADIAEDDEPAAEEDPIVGGAAASIDESLLADQPADDVDGAETAVRTRPVRRLGIVIAAVAVLIIALVVGTFLYARTQYYVAVAHGSPDVVGIYHGINGHFIVDLSRLDTRTNLPADAVLAYNPQLANGIPAKNHADAQRIVANLRALACPSPSPTPAPNTTPTPTSKPMPAPQQPSPPPTPSYCASGQ